ncbi:MAG: hypothetical protein MRERV_82c001 [Mycoplasmataceae bacterium RV_VA103A]|nr:MAG: hypothetical protein MRERV_82c001 [Mycoplasmataceae bacterium RV_VA103A]
MYQCKTSEASKKMFIINKEAKMSLLVHPFLLFCL